MALGSKAARIGLMLAAAQAFLLAAEFEYPARHDHWRRGCAGLLAIDSDGIVFREIGKKKPKHQLKWSYADIQQLEITDNGRVLVLSYKDRPWLAGKDKPYEFTLDSRPNLTGVYLLLKDRLDQRFIARLADKEVTPLWQTPVKLLAAIQGTDGTLIVGKEHVVFRALRPGASRTWRDEDIEDVSSAGPFDLTVTTLEKDGVFQFQLKQPLDAKRYDELWLRLNRQRGLELISATTEKTK